MIENIIAIQDSTITLYKCESLFPCISVKAKRFWIKLGIYIATTSAFLSYIGLCNLPKRHVRAHSNFNFISMTLSWMFKNTSVVLLTTINVLICLIQTKTFPL